MAERVLLIGMMASGKTSVGRLLATRLGWRYVDSDDEVCRNTGRSVREIFEQEGEAAFRAEERRALVDALSDDRPAVVAVAGGAVLDPDNRALIRDGGTVVWLRADPSVLARRVRAGRDHRPLLGDDPAAALHRLSAERAPLYEELAQLVVDVDDADVAAVVERIHAVLP